MSDPATLRPKAARNGVAGAPEGSTPEREVRVELVDIHAVDAENLAKERLSWLSQDERSRYERIVFAEKKHEYLVTRVLCRQLLGKLLGDSPAQLAFDLGAYGRPELRASSSCNPDAVRVRFNLSNTRGLVACAVTWDFDVGVDVEDMERNTATTAVADRFFSPHEVSALRALAPHHQARRFFELWTLKEAYIKARGLGLAIPLESFSFVVSEAGRPGIDFEPSVGDEPTAWCFEQAFPSPTHAMAIAARVEPREAPLRIVVAWTSLSP